MCSGLSVLAKVRESLPEDRLDIYKGDKTTFLRLIQEVLAVDVRSAHMREGDSVASIRLDNMVISYRRSGEECSVVGVEVWERDDVEDPIEATLDEEI
jgi:hypothetical protein